jgi:ureidoacrylate peracid hydrolase
LSDKNQEERAVSTPPSQPTIAAFPKPAETALLVIDVQNDYCHPDGALGRHGADLGFVPPAVDNILRLIETARRAGVAVFFLRNWHETWTESAGWRARVPHQSSAGKAGSWGAQFFAVTPAADEPVINKQRYDAFIGTPLDSALHTIERSTLVFTGFGTNVCVESTARHAVFLDYRIVLVSDATDTADGRSAHQATLDTISRHFGPVASTAEILAAWRGNDAAKT